MDTTPVTTLPVDTAATRRALVRKLATNITVGIVVTVASSLLINAIDRKFATTDSTED